MRTKGNIAATLALSALLGSTFAVSADDWPQWRGPNRNGISAEKGLLKEWPAGGPKLVWKISDAGSGYAAPSVVGDRIYLLGNEGLDNEFVQCLSTADGKRVWRARLGKVGNPEQKPNFPAARSTPTVEGEVLYALGSDGDLACVETAAGKIRWSKQLRTDFAGKPGIWAYAESPLVDGDTLVCTPGGSEATLVALNKNTGEVLWKCALPEGDEAAYASPIVVRVDGAKHYVQLLQKGLAGVDARTGKLAWRYAKATSAYNANIPSPLAEGSVVYVGSAGTGGGAVRIKSQDGKFEAEQLYFGSKYPTAIGGVVKVGEYLYGTTAQALHCVEFATGQSKWEERGMGAASLCYADGNLYLHGENGEVGMVTASPDGYKETGRFAAPDRLKHANPMEKSWAYPVLANGRLYIRDHGSLWCYDLRAK